MSPTPPKNKAFLHGWSEMPRPCQACVKWCTEDPNNFCAFKATIFTPQCTRCDRLHGTPCEPPVGVNKEMQSFLDVRKEARQYPNDAIIHKDFVEAGRCLQEAISKRPNTPASNENGKNQDLLSRVDFLETQHRDLIEQVSDLETEMSTLETEVSKLRARGSSQKDALPHKTKSSSPTNSVPNTPATGTSADLTRLRKEEAELDAALEIAFLEATVSRKRARVEALSQGLQDPGENEPAPSSDRPGKRQQLRRSPDLENLPGSGDDEGRH